jgi:hypothetical protein
MKTIIPSILLAITDFFCCCNLNVGEAVLVNSCSYQVSIHLNVLLGSLNVFELSQVSLLYLDVG